MDLFWRLGPASLIACTVDDLELGTLIDAGYARMHLRDEEELARQMLTHAGKYVVIPFHWLPLEALVCDAQLLRPHAVQYRCGKPNQCHANSARIWKRAKKATSIMTGFGSARDDRWRRHSWVLHKDGHIIETTVKFDLYFGIILNRAQADSFVEEVL